MNFQTLFIVLELCIGALFISLAFFAEGISWGTSRRDNGTWNKPTLPGRILFGTIGVVLMTLGIFGLA